MRSVHSTVTLPVDTERAYYAWTAGWDLWFARTDSVRGRPQVGAPFYFDVEAPAANGDVPTRHPHYGRFLELVPFERMRCTWVTGPSGTGGAETTVTVHFQALADGHTHCTLHHDGFATDEACDRHAAAWPLVLAAQAHRLAALPAHDWERRLTESQPYGRNRSVPDASFIPTRSYPDLDAAVDWLVTVLGCTERLRVPGERVQLTLGNGAVVAAAWNPSTMPASGGRPPATLVVRVANVDCAWSLALTHGATALSPPTTMPDGERQATVRDPAGHAWMLTQTVRDVDPAQWGGILLRDERG